MTMLLVSIIAILLFAGELYLWNPSGGKEIVFMGLQYNSSVSDLDIKNYQVVLINRKGQYFVRDYGDETIYMKRFAEVKEYYSSNKYTVDGRMLSPIEIILCCKWLKQIDPLAEQKSEQYDKFEGSQYRCSIRFSLQGAAAINLDNGDPILNANGIQMYSVGDIEYMYRVYMDDLYSKKIVKMLVKNWPINKEDMGIHPDGLF